MKIIYFVNVKERKIIIEYLLKSLHYRGFIKRTKYNISFKDYFNNIIEYYFIGHISDCKGMSSDRVYISDQFNLKEIELIYLCCYPCLNEYNDEYFKIISIDEVINNG